MPSEGHLITRLRLSRSADPARSSAGARSDHAGIPEGDSLADVFVHAAREHAERVAIIRDDGGTYSHGVILAAAREVCGYLRRSRGFEPGSRVALLLKNSPEYLAGFYGTLLAGGVVVPLPPDAEAERLRQIVASCEPVHLLTDAGVLRRRGDLQVAEPEPLELAGNGSQDGFDGEDTHRAGGAELAALFYTSGSTGEPKGVMLSHRNLLENARSICKYLQIGSGEKALALLPFYHAFGNSVLQTHVLSGAALVLDGSLMFPESILEAIQRHEVTSVSGVPDVFRVLLSRTSLGETELPSLRYAAVAGGRLEPDQALAVASRIAPARFFVMYGQTEATARLAFLPPGELERRYGSLGKAIPDVELEVVGEDGRPVRTGEVGEIRARGPNIMLGYWRDPELTGRTLRDGWLYTGDLARVDGHGFVYPQGRRNALAKIGGHRVHPREVEEFVERNVSVQQAVVVPYEAAEVGTRLALFVQPWNGKSGPTAEEIRRLCVDGLPRHKVPEHIEVLPELPLNDALKIDRPALGRRASAASVPTETVPVP